MNIRPIHGNQYYRVGPVYETVSTEDGCLRAEWEPSTESFRRCRINGRFVSEMTYRLSRDGLQRRDAILRSFGANE